MLLELDDTSSTRAAVGLVLNLSTRNLSDCGEELNEILVAGRPGQVADVDQVAWLAARCSEVGERVRWVGRTVGFEATSGRSTGTSEASSKSTTSSIAAAEAATTTTEASTSAKTSAEATATSEATASTKAGVAGKAVFANLKVATLPFVAVELSDSVPGIIHGLESNDARALWSTVRRDVNVCAKN